MNDTVLLSEICQERDWRLKELEFYHKTPYLYVNSLFKGHIEKYWKMCIPMLYAHWEGFVIITFRLLSDYITSQAIQFSSAPESLILLANKKRFEYLKGNCSLEQQRKFLNEFLYFQNKGFEIPSESCVSANSNLNFKQFKIILNSFNIEMTKVYNDNEANVEKLVTFRNKIAHGENSILVKGEDVNALLECVISMIDETIIIIERYILNKKYLR